MSKNSPNEGNQHDTYILSKMIEQSNTRTSKKFHELNLKQIQSPLVRLCVLVLFMGSWLEMKGLDPALMLTFTTSTVPRLLNQAASVEGQYLLSCQTEIQTPKDRVVTLSTTENLHWIIPFLWGLSCAL